MTEHQSAPAAPPLRLVFWETTAGCNLDCVHCRRLDVSHELMKTDLTTQEGRTLIDQIASAGRPVLVFSGGEPLMRPDIFELAAYAKGKGLLIALATNGTLVEAAMARRIAECGFDRVSASLDGADAATHDRFRGLAGSFERTMQGLAHLREAGVPTQINCTIAKHNKDQIEAVLRLAERVGAVAVHYFLLVPVGCGEQIADDQMLDTQEVEDRLTLIARLEQTTTLQIKPTCAPHYYRIIRQQAKAEGRAMPTGTHRMQPVGLDRLAEVVREGIPARANTTGVTDPGSDKRMQPVGSDRPADTVREGIPALANATGVTDPGSETQGVPAPASRHPAGHPDNEALHSITKGCLAGTAVCFVSHEGDVFPCGYLPVAAGNVRRQHFAEIWRDSSIFNEFRNPATLTGKCGRCEYKMVCGGCRARAFYQYGDYLAEEPYCAFEPTRKA